MSLLTAPPHPRAQLLARKAASLTLLVKRFVKLAEQLVQPFLLPLGENRESLGDHYLMRRHDLGKQPSAGVR